MQKESFSHLGNRADNGLQLYTPRVHGPRIDLVSDEEESESVFSGGHEEEVTSVVETMIDTVEEVLLRENIKNEDCIISSVTVYGPICVSDDE